MVSPQSRERFAERRRAERRRRAGRAARWWLATGAVAVVVWTVFWSSAFALDPERVQVVGSGEIVSATAVREAIADLDGVPLPRIGAGAVADRVLDVHGVESVEVSHDWPRGLTVTVVETRPVAAVPAGDGSFTLVDRAGATVAASADAPAGLPVVDVPVGAENARTLAAVLEALAALPPELAERVTTARAATEDSVVFELDGGPRVEWGGRDDAALKAAVLAVMLADPSASQAAVIDVSSPTLPVTRDD